MTHNNRGRLSVALGDGWRLYTNTIPTGARALGTVTRGIGDTGVLVQIEATGIYAQVNAGALRSLNQRKVGAAIAEARATHGGPGRGQGRRAGDGAGAVERKNVTLDATSIRRLRALGGGDLSLGTRRAAEKLG